MVSDSFARILHALSTQSTPLAPIVKRVGRRGDEGIVARCQQTIHGKRRRVQCYHCQQDESVLFGEGEVITRNHDPAIENDSMAAICLCTPSSLE